MPKRILIVEDNPIEAREIEGVLREAGFHVTVSGDAESGFAQLQSQHFDALLCDLHLPGENGFALCRRVKRADALRSTPVILVTRYSDPLNLLRGLEAGANGFISKGQGATNIRERLQRVLSCQSEEAKHRQGGADRLVFLDSEFKITAERSQLLEVLLSGFEDTVLLNSRYEEETSARADAQRLAQDTQAMYLSLVETLPMGVVRKNAAGEYAVANRMACAILGTRMGEIVGKTDFDLYPRVLAEQQRASDRHVMETGETLEECIEQGDPQTGMRYFRLLRSPVRDFAGDIVGTQITWTDISGIKQTEAELIRAKEAAENASVAKSTFLARMSHELRTPLNGVIGMTELLAGTELTDKQRQFVRACRNSSESLLQLINDILDFSKIESGKLELDCHEFDLEQIVTDTVDSISWRAAEKELEMTCQVDRDLPLAVQGDSHRLRQVLVNLLSNAVKFTESGEIDVRAETIGEQGGLVTIRFSVSDTGIGIPPERQHRLFQSFSQVDAATTRKYGGSGLGLAISQSIVELMGGRIGVDSDEGVGSTFWFEVPFMVTRQLGKDASDDSQLANCRVLIVDDNATNREIFTKYTAGWGMSHVTAACVEEALDAVNRADADGTPFRLVVTDFNMPDRTGLDLAQKLKNRPNLTVLLAGSTDLALEPSKLREFGVDATLRKPVRRRELYGAIRGLLATTQSGAESLDTSRSQTDTMKLTYHVLLAEDNSINTMYVVELMKQLGCTCDSVANGREATEAVRRQKYDLVLMDCQMPEMDGFEATRRIRQMESEGTLNGHLPIIALTANAVKGDRERCLEAGMDEYLSKPMQKDHVTSMFTQFLGNDQETATDATVATNDETDEVPEITPIDAESLLARCIGNLEFAGSLLDELQSTGLQRVEEIRNHAAQQNADAAADAAHALKGAAGILCAETIQSLAAEIERAGRSSNIENVEAQLGTLAAEMERCLNYVPQLRQDLKRVKEGA